MREYLDIVESAAEQEAWYMKGGCYQFALFLCELGHLPLYGLVDESGALHHAFVVDGKTAIDARGETSMDSIAIYKGRKSAGVKIVPVDKSEVEDYNNGPLTEEEFDECMSYANEHDQLAQLVDRLQWSDHQNQPSM